jgi:membrane peptidoglycan carboxypeptidase
MRRLLATRRSRVAVGLTALALGALGLGAAAWFASPTPSDLGRRVQARLGPSRAPTRLDAIAPVFREAVVATEDERFYRHRGIDLIGVVRAVPYDLTHLSLAQGASTITEQVAKILYLGGNDHTPWRKLEDVALALKLENRYTKEQLLDAYLNSVYFGHGAYGAWAASERYFGIAPSKLTLPQATLLAGLIQAPSADDPVLHPGAARERQVAVLRSLVGDGVVTRNKASMAVARPLPLRAARPLPALVEVDFAPGPAFIWWELVVGLIAIAAALAVLRATRRLRTGPASLRFAVSMSAVAIVVVGAALAMRSFRTA